MLPQPFFAAARAVPGSHAVCVALVAVLLALPAAASAQGAAGIDALLLKAEQSLAHKKYAAAEAAARQAVAADGTPSQLARAHHVLALAAAATGRLEAAFDHHRERIAHTPADKRGEPLLDYGLVLYEAQRYPEAAEVLRRATNADPNLAAAHGELGNALAQMGRNAEAAAAYRRAIALNPEDHGARENLQIVEARLQNAGGGAARPSAPREAPPRKAPQSEAPKREAPAASNASPVGQYHVVAYSGWAQTTIQADFTLRPDGTVIDNWTKKTWRWSFDPGTSIVRFFNGPYSDAIVTFKPSLSRMGALHIKWADLDEPAWAYRESK
jgi:tetratricopeptide (TPR) repeat protein